MDLMRGQGSSWQSANFSRQPHSYLKKTNKPLIAKKQKHAYRSFKGLSCACSHFQLSLQEKRLINMLLDLSYSVDFVETVGIIIAFHAFFCLIPLVWEACMGAATLLRAKRNTRSRLLFILPSGKTDLIFIKNREQYISSSHDFITSDYSSDVDHTQSLDLKHLLCMFAWPTIWIWGFTEL